MRPITVTKSAAGTYYIPVNVYCDDTWVRITGSMTIGSVSYTLDNISRPTQSHDPNDEEATAEGSAAWVAVTADTDGTYKIDGPTTALRVVFTGSGATTIRVTQDKVR